VGEDGAAAPVRYFRAAAEEELGEAVRPVARAVLVDGDCVESRTLERCVQRSDEAEGRATERRPAKVVPQQAQHGERHAERAGLRAKEGGEARARRLGSTGRGRRAQVSAAAPDQRGRHKPAAIGAAGGETGGETVAIGAAGGETGGETAAIGAAGGETALVADAATYGAAVAQAAAPAVAPRLRGRRALGHRV